MTLHLDKLVSAKNVVAFPHDDIRSTYERAIPFRPHYIAVTQNQGELLGVVSWANLESAACNFSGRTTIGEIERARVETVDVETPLRSAIWWMLKKNVRVLAVVHGGRFLGLIEHEDLVRFIIALMTKNLEGFDAIERFVYRSPIGQVAYFLSEAGI